MPKASTTPFTFYTFRFDYDNDEQIEKIKDYIIKEIPQYAVFIEVSDKVGKRHIQGKLGKAISEVQLRKHFKAEFPDYFVKSNYSIKTIENPEKYDSYICKDGKVLCNNVFTEEYIQEQVEIHKVKVDEFKKKESKKVLNFRQQVCVDFIKEFPADVKDIQWVPYKPTDQDRKRNEDACGRLLGYILKRLGNAVGVFDDTMLQRIYNSIKNHIMFLDDKSSCYQVELYKTRIQL